MSEYIEQAFNRRLNNTDAPKVKVNSLNDIIKLIKDIAPNHQSKLNIEIAGSVYLNDSGDTTNSKFQVSAPVHDKRQVLLQGLEVAKKLTKFRSIYNTVNITINGRTINTVALPDEMPSVWIDDLISVWFDGYRDGHFICWKLGKDIYKYDIFEHKLFNATE